MRSHPPAVERMIADAAALAEVIAWEDFRNGFMVIAEPLPAGLNGVALGRGVGMAKVFGDRHGRASVWVDPDKFTLGADEPTPEMVAGYMVFTLHEMGHAVTWADVPDADAAMACLNQPSAFAQPKADVLASWHCHRWAAACAVLLVRAMPFRMAIADTIRSGMARDVRRYGFELDAVVEAVADFPKGSPLLDVLAVGGEWDLRLAERLPALETRLAAIAEVWPQRPVGERGLA